MSETPKCPYCGAEMKVDTVRLTQHNWVGWYHCENCRSVGPSKSNCYTEKDAEESALSAALHRAEPEMRPLTLEEVLELGKDEDSIVYIESRRFGRRGWCQPCAIIFNSSAEGQKNEIHFYEPGNELPDFWPEAEYGKTWRCWLRKPTAEEMESEKWEE